MRFFLALVTFLVAAEAVDTIWFNGRYGHALWQDVSDSTQQFGSFGGPPVIHVPNLARHWKVP